MSDTTEKIILQVKLDYGDAIKQNAEIAKNISLVKDQMKLLSDTGKANTAEYEAQKVALKQLQDQYRIQTKAVNDSITANKSEAGSIKQLRAEVNKMTSDYIALSAAERKSASGVEMQKSIRSKTDELKKLESAIGNNTRNVGNYVDAFRGLDGPLGKFLTTLSSTKESFIKAKQGIDLSRSGFEGFNGVLKASALGVIITLLGGLIAAFTKFTPLVDKAEQAFASINAVVDVFVERMTSIGRGLVEIVNGNFSEGINQIRNSFDGMGQAMLNSANAASELTKEIQDLEDAQRGQDINNARTQAQVEKLILQSKDRTKSEKERLSALDQASKLERENLKKQEEITDKVYDNQIKQLQLKSSLSKKEIEDLVNGTLAYDTEFAKRGTISDADLDKLKEISLKKIQFQSDSVNLEEKITNRRNALIDAENTARAESAKKALEEQIKFDAKLKEVKEKALVESTTIIDNEFKKQEIALNTSLENKLITQQQYDAQLLQQQLINLEAQKENLKLFGKDTTDIELQISKTKLDITKARAEDEKAINDARLKAEASTQQGIIGIANNAQEVFGKQSLVGKATAIASTTISTYAGATKAFEAYADIPGIGPVLGSIAAGLAIAAGLKNVAAIQGVNFGGAAAGGGDFMTKGPTLLMVGDNPGGVERVTVEPISGKGQTRVSPGGNLVAMAGGGSITSFGGYAERNSFGAASVIDYSQLAESLANINIVTRITDINKVNGNILKTKVVANI